MTLAPPSSKAETALSWRQLYVQRVGADELHARRSENDPNQEYAQLDNMRGGYLVGAEIRIPHQNSGAQGPGDLTRGGSPGPVLPPLLMELDGDWDHDGDNNGDFSFRSGSQLLHMEFPADVDTTVDGLIKASVVDDQDCWDLRRDVLIRLFLFRKRDGKCLTLVDVNMDGLENRSLYDGADGLITAEDFVEWRGDGDCSAYMTAVVHYEQKPRPGCSCPTVAQDETFTCRCGVGATSRLTHVDAGIMDLHEENYLTTVNAMLYHLDRTSYPCALWR